MKRPGQPRNGQPKIEVCFRGQGKRIKKEERAGWHKDVVVRFQRKAWYDEALCLEFAKTRMPEVTRGSEGRQRVSPAMRQPVWAADRRVSSVVVAIRQDEAPSLSSGSDRPSAADRRRNRIYGTRTHARTHERTHARTHKHTHARTHARTHRSNTSLASSTIHG